MKLYQKLNLYVLSFLFTQIVFAQDGLLTGILQDEKEETVPFATVAVIKLPDSTIVTGTTTDLDGRFELKPNFTGEVALKFSAIGFSSVYTPSFMVTDPGFTRDFGLIKMREEVNMLNEVMVETWRPTVKAENGNLQMRVEGTTLAAGTSAYEVLSLAPAVSVDQNGNFMLNGKAGVAVMIDGRPTYLAPSELKSLLESMPAENIKDIEVLNSPPAKYDAEGTAGILNITLKKNSMSGFSGSAYAGYTYNRLHLFNGGMNLSHKAGKWNSYFNLDFSEDGKIRDQESLRRFAGTDISFEQVGEDVSRTVTPSLNLGTNYQIHRNHRIGFMANFTYEERTTDWNTLSTILNGDLTNIDARNYTERRFGHGRLNLHYVGELDTLGTTISADIDYGRLDSEDEGLFRNHYTYPSTGIDELQTLTNTGSSYYDIYAARLDLSLPLSYNSTLEAGVKASRVISNSDLLFYLHEEQPVYDPNRSDRFRYEEDIYAGYASLNHRFNITWTVTAGLRAERTVSRGKSFSMSQNLDRDYLDLFPTLSLEQNVSENYKISYAFNRRIKRPNYSHLNPFIFYLDPYTYVEGNPEMDRQITNSFQLSQNFLKKFNLLLSYDFADNYITEIPSMNPETRETVFTRGNMDYYQSYGATLVAPVQLASFWNTSNTLVFTHQDFNLQTNGKRVQNKNDFYLIQSNHQVRLPAGLVLEINGTYQGPVASSLYRIGSQWWVDAGLKKSFLNEQLNVTLRATDLFQGRRMQVSADFLGNTYRMNQYFGNQAISLNLRYNFANGNAQGKTRQSDLEEMDRAGAN